MKGQLLWSPQVANETSEWQKGVCVTKVTGMETKDEPSCVLLFLETTALGSPGKVSPLRQALKWQPFEEQAHY